MNETRNTYQDTYPGPAQKPSAFSLIEFAMIRLLLAGMYFLLGVSKADRLAYRERALWLRKLQYEVNLDTVLEAKKNLAIAQWSRDHGLSWQERVAALTISNGVIPTKRSAAPGFHPIRTKVPYHNLGAKVIPKRLYYALTGYRICAAVRPVRYDNVVCRAPP